MAGLVFISPVAMLNASARWQTIWCAVILPQREALSACTVCSRRRTSDRSAARARVFMSAAEELLSARLAEGRPRTVTAGLRASDEVQEPGVSAQRVELRAPG